MASLMGREADSQGSLKLLKKAWAQLRLSVRAPARFPPWDAIVLTAASPAQAELYQRQLLTAQHFGRISEQTLLLAVPDPEGKRIGSGGATLAALRALSQVFDNTAPASVPEATNSAIPATAAESASLAKLKVLLVHAGGDSKRVPWANPAGKPFIPLPLLAEEDPDGPITTLFDHILAVAAPATAAFGSKGGLLIMTGDVLPCFNSGSLAVPEDGACVVTTLAPLDVASRHGVIVALQQPQNLTGVSQGTVADLLQKPTVQEMVSQGATVLGGMALLDTGLFALRGAAWEDLISMAELERDPVLELLESGQEMSLYEELAGAWVPARHQWLALRPLGSSLICHLGRRPLFYHLAPELDFLHFGTTSEVLEHLSKVPSSHLSLLAPVSNPRAIILNANVSANVNIGAGSLVCDTKLAPESCVGSRSVVVGVVADQVLTVLDNTCLWSVPLRNGQEVHICCGVDDNPKDSADSATFCGIPLRRWMAKRGIEEREVWPSEGAKKRDLWGAKIFPSQGNGRGFEMAMWLMGVEAPGREGLLNRWRSSDRFSLADIHFQIDFTSLDHTLRKHRASTLTTILKHDLNGLLARDLSSLTTQLASCLGNQSKPAISVLYEESLRGARQGIPYSRVCRVRADLALAKGDTGAAEHWESSAWQAVVDETRAAVVLDSETTRGGVVDHSPSFNSWLLEREQRKQPAGQHPPAQPSPPLTFPPDPPLKLPAPGASERVHLPIRLDIVGGWSDTPPWSLERVGRVLNLAALLNGAAPVGGSVLVTPEPGVLIEDDLGERGRVPEPEALSPPLVVGEPFAVVKAALLVCGYAGRGGLLEGEGRGGLKIMTSASVPRGSGLGTSSILAAALVRALLRLGGGKASEEEVSHKVLLLEQVMGTGGGWQDQVGALWPGAKCTVSLPTRPMRVRVEEVPLLPALREELEQRLVLVFTGQVRLARNVLQNVVTRYLQRDARALLTVERLAELAKVGQRALAVGDLELLGAVMSEAWGLHQELYSFCSNQEVDELFKAVEHLSLGHKLVGAGGGGFAILLASSREAASQMKDILSKMGDPVRVYDWTLAG